MKYIHLSLSLYIYIYCALGDEKQYLKKNQIGNILTVRRGVAYRRPNIRDSVPPGKFILQKAQPPQNNIKLEEIILDISQNSKPVDFVNSSQSIEDT